MQEASEEMEFERAIEYRELLNSVSQIAQKQKLPIRTEKTKISLHWRVMTGMRWFRCFYPQWKDYRKGSFHVRVGSEESTGDILVNFVKQYYSGTPFIPREIMLQEAIEDIPVLEEWLTANVGGK